MLLGTDAEKIYSEQQLADMLNAAGIKNIRRAPVQPPDESGLLAGEK